MQRVHDGPLPAQFSQELGERMTDEAGVAEKLTTNVPVNESTSYQ